MTWIKQNDNQYIHDQAPYSLVLSNGIWFVIDNRDQSKAIPFDDILNNPVFPADFSNQTILARHFRGQSTGDLASPPHSFQGEINSGLYRESAGVLAFAVLGNKVLEINSLPSTLCRAWVNFNGTLSSPITPRGSLNVSSITKTGAGDYTINFLNNMPDTNYAIVCIGHDTGTIPSSLNRYANGYSYTNSSFRIFTGIPATASGQDLTFINIAVFR